MEEPPTFSDEEIESMQVEVDGAELKKEKSDRPFEFYYHQLMMALASGDPTGFNKLVHPEFGCYLIESPGAVPVIMRITDIDMVIKRGANQPVIDFSNVFRSHALKNESLPTVDCDSPNGFYSKTGVFVQDINTLAEQKIWEHIDMKETDQEPISKLADTVNKTIINTVGFTVYFSQIGDEWYVTFLDIRVPCTA